MHELFDEILQLVSKLSRKLSSRSFNTPVKRKTSKLRKRNENKENETKPRNGPINTFNTRKHITFKYKIVQRCSVNIIYDHKYIIKVESGF